MAKFKFVFPNLSDSLEKIGDLPKIESLSGSVKDYLKNKVLLNLHLNLFLVFQFHLHQASTIFILFDFIFGFI